MMLRVLGAAGFIMVGAFAHATWILVEVGWGVL